jgi:hypothetical protein
MAELPCFALWKNEDSIEHGYVTGLQPATVYATTRAIERKHGRVPTLAAGESRTFHVDEYVGGARRRAVGHAVMWWRWSQRRTHRAPIRPCRC